MESGGIWQVGRAQFDTATGELLVEGTPVALDRSARRILTALALNPGQEVSKDQLLEIGWPGRIVHDNSLAKAISRLRTALGGDGHALQAVYGHGYKLVPPKSGPKEETGPASANAAIDREPVVSQGPLPHRRKVRSRLVVIFLIIFVVLLGLAFSLQRNSDAIPIRSTPPLIGDPANAVGRLLWVDDHPSNNSLERELFEKHGIAVHEVLGTDDAMRLLAMYDYTLVISDMGRTDNKLAGLDLARRMRQKGIEVPLFIYTVQAEGADQQKAQLDNALEAGATRLVVRPEDVRREVLEQFGNPPMR